MADLGFAVNVDELPEAQDFSPVPVGDYTVIITNTVLNPTNDTKKLMQSAGVESYDQFRKTNPKASGYLRLEMDIQDGGAVGRKLFHNLNLINDNDQAREISAGQLRQIMEALGLKSLPDGKTEALHNKRLKASVGIKPAKPYIKDGKEQPGSPQNEIKKFSAAGASAAVASTAQAATGTVGKGPWAR